MRKGLGLERGGLPLCRLPFPLNGLERGAVPGVVMGEGRREKRAEEVEEAGSRKCCSRFFS